MDSGQAAMIAVREERARIGGVEVAKKTVVAATDEGVMCVESGTIRQPAYLNLPGSLVTTQIHTVETITTTPVIQQPLPPPPTVMPLPAPPVERTCVDICFGCDSSSEWYELKGKGICWILILLLCYLVAGTVVIVLGVAWLACKCIALCSDD